jgi:hypothetical protein
MAINISVWNQPIEKLEKALNIKRQIDRLETRLASVLGGRAQPAAKQKGTMSLAARKRIAAAQRIRWAKIRGTATSARKPAKRKSGLTPAGRQKLSQLMKARWAARRKTEKTSS